MQVKKIARNYIIKCNTLEGSPMDPKRIYAADPRYFGGISPQSVYWVEIVEILTRYQSIACNSISVDDYAQFYANEYEKTMTETELKAAVNFYSSKSGRHYNAASFAATTALQSFSNARFAAASSAALMGANDDLTAVAVKYAQSQSKSHALSCRIDNLFSTCTNAFNRFINAVRFW